MRADDWPTPTRIIGELLTSHPEAESLLAEAGHRQAFAAWSTAGTGTKFTGAQAARRGYEELWHRLEPRRGRSVPFEVGLLVLAVAGAGLAMLDFVQPSRLYGEAGPALLALAAAAVWVTIAWLATVTGRRRCWVLLSGVVAAAMALDCCRSLCMLSLRTQAGRRLAAYLAVAGSSASSSPLSSSCSWPAPPVSSLTWNRSACSLPGYGGIVLASATRRQYESGKPIEAAAVATEALAMSRMTTRIGPRPGVLPIDADLRQYCLRKLSPELQTPLLLCHPPVAIRWAASRVLAAGR